MTIDQTNSRQGALAWETLLPLAGAGPLVERLEHALREAISSGRLHPGATLPPSRQLAETLGVSRWVVTQTYSQLVAEGVLEARVGAGTRVAGGPTRATAAAGRRSPSDEVAPLPASPGFDLRPGVPDLRHVPREAWARAVREALATASNADLGALPAAGHPATRSAVAAHLRRARMIEAPDSAVVITRGATEAMARIAVALRAAGHTHVLVEDPSWPGLREAARRAGLEPVPVAVDDGGVDVARLEAASARTGARAALLTPAHQFPTGVPLAGARREAVLGWARAVDGVVIEDDYDAEFRYDRRPVAALQRLDPDRVILVGSVSKTMSPAFGIGWMVLPDSLRAAVEATPGGPPSGLDQLAFTQLVVSGGYDRHLRAARTRYRRRHDALVHALAAALPTAEMTGLAAGLHLVLHLPPEAPDAAEVVRRAAALDVGVVDMRRYEVTPSTSSRRLVLGYGNLADARLTEAVTRLASCVR